MGVVGLGYGRYGFVPAFRLDSRCDVVAICATSAERARKVADDLNISKSYGNHLDMITECDLDAVAIAVPPAFQSEIAIAALERSVAVFGEKPLAANLRDAESLCSAAARAQVANMIDFIFPEIEAWECTRHMIQDGAIGSVRHVIVQWIMESYDIYHRISTWKTDSSRGGGVLQHFASHAFYYLEWFLGPLGSLFASLSTAPDVSRPGDTLAVLSGEFVSGASASVTVCSSAYLGSGHRLEFYGSGGSLVLSNVTDSPVKGFRVFLGKRGDKELSEVPIGERTTLPESLDTRVAPLSRETTRFCDWIESGNATHPNFEDGLRVQSLLDAAIRSHAMARRMSV